MSLVGEGALQMFRVHRILSILGRYGSYKTACSVRLGIEFCERGWSRHIICNFPCAVATDPMRVGDFRDIFIILDEGGAGLWLNDRTFAQASAFLRKRNLFLVIPSALPPVMKAKSLNMQMSFDGHSAGMDFVRYTLALDNVRVHERTNLLWLKPSEVFGLYDTQYPSPDSGGILTLMNAVFKADGVGREVETNPNDSSWDKPYEYLKAAEKGAGKESSPESALIPDGVGLSGMEEVRRLIEDGFSRQEEISDREASVPVHRRRRRSS